MRVPTCVPVLLGCGTGSWQGVGPWQAPCVTLGTGQGAQPAHAAAGRVAGDTSTATGHAGRGSGLLSPHRLFTERQQLNYRLHSVSCTGTEVHLSMCSFEFYRGNSSAACGTGMPAVVSCVPGPLFATGNAHKKKQRQQQQQQGQVSPAGRGMSPVVAQSWTVPHSQALCGCMGYWVTSSGAGGGNDVLSLHIPGVVASTVLCHSTLSHTCPCSHSPGSG